MYLLVIKRTRLCLRSNDMGDPIPEGEDELSSDINADDFHFLAIKEVDCGYGFLNLL